MFKKDKFKTLVHYICDICDTSQLGSTKLNKILWYSDIEYYLLKGKSITNEKYIKREFGPVPSHILEIIDELKSEKKLAVKEPEYIPDNRKYISLQKPDLSIFTAEEIDIVVKNITEICKNHTARSISEKTHDRLWELALIGEEIPYFAIFASNLGEINEDDIEWVIKELEKTA